jgi:hypothetical protein
MPERIAGWRLDLGDHRTLRLQELRAIAAREKPRKIENPDA